MIAAVSFVRKGQCSVRVPTTDQFDLALDHRAIKGLAFLQRFLGMGPFQGRGNHVGDSLEGIKLGLAVSAGRVGLGGEQADNVPSAPHGCEHETRRRTIPVPEPS